MAIDLLLLLARTSLAFSAAILVALAIRMPLRRMFGLQRAYTIWLLVPLALVGSLMPVPHGSGPKRLLEVAQSGLQATLNTPSGPTILMIFWICGFCFSLVLIMLRHAKFLDEARSGLAGPAIIGVIRPKLVVPLDFKNRFSTQAQMLIRAHERIHMERDDARWNALALLLQALFWFNPLAHLAARAMKLDQELACDALVIDRYPQDRRIYAKALLSELNSGAPSPLGCHWSTRRAHPLVSRLQAIVNRARPTQREGLWTAISLSLWACAFTTAWAMQPPNRTPDKHAVQYVHFTRSTPSSPSATWRIAVQPD